MLIDCKNCGAHLGAVNSVADGGTVEVSEFVCQCGQGVRSHYHPGKWACGNYVHAHAGKNCRCLKLCSTCKQPEGAHR